MACVDNWKKKIGVKMSFNTVLGNISYEDFERQLAELVNPSNSDPVYLQNLTKQIKAIITPKKGKKTVEQNTNGLVLVYRAAKESSNKDIRQISYVLMRQLIKKNWSIIQEEFKVELKKLLLESILRESESPVRHSISAIIASIVSREMGSSTSSLMQRWPQIMEWINYHLYTTSESNMSGLAIALDVLSEIPNGYVSVAALHGPVPNAMGWNIMSKDKKLKKAASANTAQLQTLVPLFSAILEKRVGVNSQSPVSYPLDVTINAIKCLNAIYNISPGKNFASIVDPFMIPVAEVLKVMLVQINAATSSLSASASPSQNISASDINQMRVHVDVVFCFFVDIFDSVSVVFTKEKFADFLKYFLEIAVFAKHQALNIILSLIYGYLKYFKMESDSDKLTTFLLESLFNLLITIDEESGDDEELEAKRMVLNVIDTLAIELSPHLIIDPINTLVQRCSTGGNMDHVRACMNILGTVAEGCSEYMKPYCELYMGFLLKGLHGYATIPPPILNASLQCLTMLSLYIGAHIKDYHHETIVTILLELLVRVKSGPIGTSLDEDDEKFMQSVLSSFDAYFELLEEKEIAPRLQIIVPKLAEATSHRHLVCLGTVISAAADSFKPYVEQTWQLIHNIIQYNLNAHTAKLSHANSSNTKAALSGVDKNDTYLVYISTTLYTLSSLLKTEIAELKNPEFIRSVIHETMACIKTEDNEVTQNAIEVFGALAKLLKEDFSAIHHEVLPLLKTYLDEDAFVGRDNGDESEDIEIGPNGNTAEEFEDIFDGEDDDSELDGFNEALVDKKCSVLDTYAMIAEHAPLFSVEAIVMATWESIYTDGMCNGPTDIRKSSIATLTQYCLAMHKAKKTQYLPQMMSDYVTQVINIIDDDVDTILLINAMQSLETLADSLGMVAFGDKLGELLERVNLIIGGQAPAQLVRTEDNEVNVNSYGEYDQLLIENAISFYSLIAKAIGPAYDATLLVAYIDIAKTMFNKNSVRNGDCVILGVLAEILDAIITDNVILNVVDTCGYNSTGSPLATPSMAVERFTHEDTVLEVVYTLGVACFGNDGVSSKVEDDDTLANAMYLLGLAFQYSKMSLVCGNAASKASAFFNQVLVWIGNLLSSPRIQKSGLFYDNTLGALARTISANLVFYEQRMQNPYLQEVVAKLPELFAILLNYLPVRNEVIENHPIIDLFILSAAKHVAEIQPQKQKIYHYLTLMRDSQDLALAGNRLDKLNSAISYYAQ